MNNKEFLKRRVDHTQKRFELCDRKDIEYARSSDRLANFFRVAQKYKIHPLKVLAVYREKHLDGIAEFICRLGRGEYTEDIIGRIYDAENYDDLLLDMIETMREYPERFKEWEVR